MPSIDFDIGRAPVDVTPMLTTGTTYAGQNLSTTATIFFREAATVPTLPSFGFRVEASGSFTLKPSGPGIWFWTDDAAGAPIIVTESP